MVTALLLVGAAAPAASADDSARADDSAAADTIATTAWRDEVNLRRADLKTFTMVLMNDGAPAGSMTYGWRRDRGRYIIKDRTEMKPNIVETAEAVIDAKTLLPEAIHINFAVGGDAMKVDLSWQGNRRSGVYLRKRGKDISERTVNILEDDAMPLRMAVIGIVPALPLKEGFRVSLPWFNTLANRAETIELMVTGSERIKTPVGTFSTYRVALNGGSPENIIYVSKRLPRVIVRIDVVGRPMHFLLTS